MKILSFSFVALASLVFHARTACSHPGHSEGARESHQRRVWKTAHNVEELEGSMLLEKDGLLHLEQRDGSVIRIPVGELSETDRLWAERQLLEIRRLNAEVDSNLLAFQSTRPPTRRTQPVIASYFDMFRKKVTLRWDDRYLYVESNGLPDHPMMIGITAWQQQVPIPQPYTGENAWQIPLNPEPASRPMSAKSNFFRGAIALAVNGVPIFNPIKNDGRTDTLQAGELDQWGGHCGRADDYHYHIAPVHLEKIAGKGRPVAIALDGYPIYGYLEADGSKPRNLDWLNGHKNSSGQYHYHATKTYPYLNGGFYGEVVERGGQVDPQPRGRGVRPHLPPLRGAKITGFDRRGDQNFVVEYDVYGEKRSVSYQIANDRTAMFEFSDENGTTKETYTPRPDRGDRRPPRDDRRRPPPRGGRKPPRQDRDTR